MLTEDQLAKLRTAGKVAGAARELGLSMVKEGVKLYDVAQEVEGYIREHGCGLAFPCNISINEIAAHYTPSCTDKKVFELGDVVKVDCGAHLDGYVGDTAGTVEVGTNAYRDLIEASRNARNTVAEFIGDGIPLSEIGKAVEMTINRMGFAPVVNLCGHQIEPYNLHAGLSVPSYDNGSSETVKSGMVVAVEPFATNGAGEIRNGKPGNIVRFVRDRKVADPKAAEFVEYVKEEFRTFPFCARSCDFPDAEKHVKALVRHGVLSSYAELVEVKGGIVSQHEYTFYIDGARGEVTTLP
ncbi:MAG: type II methionyl aminopeptidase [Candidatus Methanomethylophilaceae archaeon]|jgi:methionyl aminopeptidase|nr:type II methionyl aminopeptidase [Candidatus Methanomethylophilaceae archaeon]MBR7005694.1 type II methionyl aminopeptidase [Candidatus Methanomethylophilaceae archaeon]